MQLFNAVEQLCSNCCGVVEKRYGGGGVVAVAEMMDAVFWLSCLLKFKSSRSSSYKTLVGISDDTAAAIVVVGDVKDNVVVKIANNNK